MTWVNIAVGAEVVWSSSVYLAAQRHVVHDDQEDERVR